jgi:capping protein alpha
MLSVRRAALEASAATYLAAHYHSGVSAVFAPTSASSLYTVQIVANKYNPTNFWCAASALLMILNITTP